MHALENDVPDKLPPIDFATPKLKKDVRKLVRKFGSEQEIEQVEEMIENRSLAGLQYDGEEGDGDLSGRPAHFSCVDRSGELWRVDVRVLDELAPQPWAISREREAKVRSLTRLAEEERLNLPRIVLDNDRSVAHPPWHGARELSQHELQQNAAFDREGQPWKIVATLLPTVSDSKELKGLKIHKKTFIAWMREHEVPHMYLAADGKRKPLTKPECVKAVWQHFQSCSCDLESDADSNAARDSGRGRQRKRRKIERMHEEIDDLLDRKDDIAADSGSSSDTDDNAKRSDADLVCVECGYVNEEQDFSLRCPVCYDEE
eukprot:g40987.t1